MFFANYSQSEAKRRLLAKLKKLLPLHSFKKPLLLRKLATHSSKNVQKIMALVITQINSEIQ